MMRGINACFYVLLTKFAGEPGITVRPTGKHLFIVIVLFFHFGAHVVAEHCNGESPVDECQ